MDFQYFLLIGNVQTNDVAGFLLIEIVRKIGHGDSLLIGIVPVIDYVSDYLLIGVDRTIFFGCRIFIRIV